MSPELIALGTLLLTTSKTEHGLETRMYAVLEYTYEDNYLETREKYRPVHLKAAWEAVERGEPLLGGAVGDGS
ncbi:hypothetical protein FDW83_14350 [Pseudarthrobacter sp. NamE2]|uniref:hypothetical protein n=1 Tax=Pseudarthrobacter sp. NamE2 TaxID=2576838 RepID=UPI0010FE8A16|nr:hypothetical protein [Pseudarthrobacter sp. NamE2]TLM81914.1 hypothetical protein FDW83_14350 [Pseudarthrobacter sp. NamE2]